MPTPQARRQRAAVAVFVLTAGLLLAWRSEHQDQLTRGIVHRLDVDAWQQYHDRAVNIADTLNLRSQLVRFEPALAPIYDQHRLIVPDCGERP